MTAVNLCYRVEGDSERFSSHQLILGFFMRKKGLSLFPREFFKRQLDIVKSREGQESETMSMRLSCWK